MTALDVLERCRETGIEYWRLRARLHGSKGGAGLVSWYGERIGSRGAPVYGVGEEWIASFVMAMECARVRDAQLGDAELVLNMLPKRERSVLRDYYVHMMSMRSIANEHGFSLPRAQRIKREGDILAERIFIDARTVFLSDWRKSEHADS